MRTLECVSQAQGVKAQELPQRTDPNMALTP
jgi:hypothetical protein